MPIYYNRLLQGRGYRPGDVTTINTDGDFQPPSRSQRTNDPKVNAGLSLNETAGVGNGATDGEQGQYKAGG